MYSAEAKAICMALDEILMKEESLHIICTDSLSVITGIADIYTISPRIVQIHELLHRCVESDKRIIFVWTPGHVNILGNKQADLVAKAATRKDELGDNFVTQSELKALSKNEILREWQMRWQNTGAKLEKIKKNVKRWSSKDGLLSRRDQRIINRIRSGHTRITHSFVIERENQPFCEKCNAEVTIDYLLWECKIFESARNQTGIKPENLIGSNEGDKKILKFLKMTGAFISNLTRWKNENYAYKNH